jgi:type III restriction enzyme
MPPRGKPAQMEEPPADWTPSQAVPEPVINRPYEKPQKYWRYNKDGSPIPVPERRRASYWYKTKRTGSSQQDLFMEEEADDLPLVNRLRDDVEKWRESKYRGASAVTRDLLVHWWNPERARRLFFCQLEAAETIIYLLEIVFPGRLGATGFRSFKVSPADLERLVKGEKPEFEELTGDFFPRLTDPPADGDLLPLRRLGCKMATGSGKTVVMAMLITWAFCNRGRNPATLAFPRGVLICAPNLTIKERLQVLRPEHPFNYYDLFDIVPSKYRELMGSGRVLVTNWHAFAPKSEHREGDATYRVVNKGEETPEAFAKDRLGDLANRAPILVLNDEGHHCWRPKVDKPETHGLTKEERNALEEEVEEARVWLAGLDRINNAGLAGDKTPSILACVDLSATPFYLDNSGYPAGSPFPWLVSDFGLVDAIESGIVKVPRLPVKDDTAKKDEVGRPDPKYYRLWRHIDDQLGSGDRLANGRPKPEAVYREAEGALITLYVQWQKAFEEIRDKSVGREAIPPVMIVVCDNVDIAEVFLQEISGERVVEVPSEDGKKTENTTVYRGSPKFPVLANTEAERRTVRIDTKLLAKIETEEGETKDEAAERLRQVINTVGKAGLPGEHVRCVVSVGMLTEGWDATNVTHILGVRAFGSQLLCEQVVGRGLRRMSYEPRKEDGLLDTEYVDVYGIPFSLIPFKGKAKETEDRTVVYHHVYALPERAAFQVRMPVVESYTYDLRDSGIRCDVDGLEGFVVQHEPTEVYLVATRGYRDVAAGHNPGEFVRQDRREYYKTVRFQQLLFSFAQLIVEDLVAGAQNDGGEAAKRGVLARHLIFPEVLRIVTQYVERKVRFAPGVDRRELALQKYVRLLRQRVRDGILPAAARDDAPLLPIVNSYQPSVSTTDVNYRTARRVVSLTRSHMNLAPVYSDWEQQAIEIMEDMDAVECYVATDRNVGLTIAYEYENNHHQYFPDFVVRMRGGKLVLLEIKGRGGELWDEDRVLAKNAAAKKWVAAVNNAKRWGQWAFEICRDLAQLRAMLERHAAPVTEAKVLPFRIVTPQRGDHYRTCVPLTSLRAAAGRFSEEQAGFDDRGEWAEEWLTWDGAPKFEPGMFVAKVLGDSMEPEIPNGSYCLFRAPRAGSRQGRKLLVWHSGISDPHTGGQYTLKVYTSEKAAEEEGDWRHTRIILKPLNPAHAPIVLTPESENDVRVMAEFVQVVGLVST